jgi:hypothetical protein
MTIEIHTPELEQRMKREIQSGQFQDVDDLLTKIKGEIEQLCPR